ncbi:MAG: ATP-grasp domain-containing protein [Candidatus Moranbacteria bacterium]|nr:ATP-grasp domain-containing protein [Candidatus Moranbacteria bacterium]
MKKINLAVVFYGNLAQEKTNQVQFNDLKNNLVDFQLRKYDFNKDEQEKMLKDFKDGKIDIVLKNSYGRGHENQVELFLESHGIPYLGSDSKATFIGTSKYLAKKLFRLHGLPVVEDIVVFGKNWQSDKKKIMTLLEEKINFPCIIKDSAGTDSRGIFIVNNKNEAGKVLDVNLKEDSIFIVEKYIENPYELTCLVVGNQTPYAYEPVGLNNDINGIVTGDMKDNNSSIKLEIPINLPKIIIEKAKQITKKAHSALGCKTFSRADILVKNGKLYLLEVDVHTGFRTSSATSVAAKFSGESLNDLFLKFYNLSR